MIAKRDNKEKVSSYRHFLMIAFIFVFWTGISVFFTNITFVEGLVFWLYQLIAVFGVGWLIIENLQLSFSFYSQKSAISYAIGYAVQIMNWFIFMPVVGNRWFVCVYLIEILCLCVIYIKKHINTKRNDILYEEDHKELIAIIICVSVIIGIKFIVSAARNMIPYDDYSNPFMMNQDFLFYIQNIASAKNYFPMRSMFQHGVVFFYHYFGSVASAVESLVTGISAAKLELQLSYIGNGFFLAISFFSFIQMATRKIYLKIVGFSVLFLTAGFETYCSCCWTSHLYVCPFGFDVGISLLMIQATIIQNIRSREKFNYRLGILLGINMAVLTGVKGPFAIIALFACGLLCIECLKNGKIKSAILSGAILICCFLIVYLFVISNTLKINVPAIDQSIYASDTCEKVNSDSPEEIEQQVNINTHEYEVSTSLFAKPMTSMRTYGIADTARNLVDRGYPFEIAGVIVFIKYFIYSQPVLFILGLLSMMIAWGANSKLDKVALIYVATYIFSGFMVAITRCVGSSEMYFMMAGFPFATYALISVLDGIEEKVKSKVLYTVVSLVVAGGIVLFFFAIRTDYTKGVKIITKGCYEEEDKFVTMTPYEYEGYIWIQNHTTENDICVTNEPLYADDTQRIASAISERIMWLSSPDSSNLDEKRLKLIDEAYNDNRNDAWDRIKNAGIKYVINDRSLKKTKEMENSDLLLLVYENKEMQIFEFK